MTQHICDKLSSGVLAKVTQKVKYKPVNGANVVSWSTLWPIMWTSCGRQHWGGYLGKLGIPKSAINIKDKKHAGTLLLGALIHAGHIPPHPLVQVTPKAREATLSYPHQWPTAAA